MKPAVRLATVEDARRIGEIHVSGWHAAYRGFMPDDFLDSFSVDLRARQRRKALESPANAEVRTWVVERAGAVAGFAVTGPARDGGPAAELYALYVDPAAWGTGCGRTLLAAAVADLAERDFPEVALWVLGSNARARRFYEVAGFAADGTTKDVDFGGALLREVRYRAAL